MVRRPSWSAYPISRSDDVDFAETWKQWTAVIGASLAISSGIVGYRLVYAQVQDHDGQLTEHQQLLDELVKARLAENAAEQAAKTERNRICRELREAGKIKKGECPPLEP